MQVQTGRGKHDIADQLRLQGSDLPAVLLAPLELGHEPLHVAFAALVTRLPLRDLA